jgi:hypothetical protein
MLLSITGVGMPCNTSYLLDGSISQALRLQAPACVQQPSASCGLEVVLALSQQVADGDHSDTWSSQVVVIESL